MFSSEIKTYNILGQILCDINVSEIQHNIQVYCVSVDYFWLEDISNLNLFFEVKDKGVLEKKKISTLNIPRLEEF